MGVQPRGAVVRLGCRLGAGGIEPLVGHLTCFVDNGFTVRREEQLPRVCQCGGWDSNPHCRGPHPRASCQLGYRRVVRAHDGRGGIRTLNDSILNRAPLPVGLPGLVREWPEWDSNPQQQRPERCASAGLGYLAIGSPCGGWDSNPHCRRPKPRASAVGLPPHRAQRKSLGDLGPPRLCVAYQDSEARGLDGSSSQETKQAIINRELRHWYIHSFVGSIHFIVGNASQHECK